MPELPTLFAGILIGGQSTRMGRPKHLIEWNGRTLLARIVEVVAPFVERVALLGAGDVPAELAHLERISDAPGVAGPLAGILGAMRAHPEAAWLFVACDMPYVSAEAIRWLVAQRTPDQAACLPSVEPGGVEPLLAIYEPAALRLLAEAAARGSYSPRALAGMAGVRIAAVPEGIRGAWINVNHPEQLRGV